MNSAVAGSLCFVMRSCRAVMWALVLSVLLVPLAGGYNILGVFPSRDRTDFLVYGTFFRELASRGHSVTLIGNYPMQNAPATFKEILLTKNSAQKALSFESVISSDALRVPFETLVWTKAGNDECKVLVNNTEVKSLIYTRPKFDVIIVESLNSDCGFALAHNLTGPYIAFMPQSLQPWQYSRLGIPFGSAHTPLSSTSYGRRPWFLERIMSFLLYQVANWMYYVASQVTDRVHLYRHLGDDLPPLETLAANASLVLLNSHAPLTSGTVGPDNLVHVGGLHLRTPRVLPTELERFIAEAEHGVIYVSLGSTVLDSTMPSDKLQELVKLFSRLKQRVVWKWDPADSRINMPRNFIAKKWMPQYDILRHGNVLAFISHCGMLSATEAVASGLPVICVPLFEHQYGSAAALRDAGLATVVDYEDMDETVMREALKEVLKPSWQLRAQELAKIWHDRPMSALETAIYWTEYVARHKGASHLRPASIELPWYLYYQLDVLVSLSLVAYAIIFIFARLLTYICCCGRDEVVTEISRSSKRVKFE